MGGPCRAPSDVSRAGVVSDVMEIINSVCKGRGLQCVVGRVHDAEAVQCSQNIVQDLVAAVKASQKVQLCPLHLHALCFGLTCSLKLSLGISWKATAF